MMPCNGENVNILTLFFTLKTQINIVHKRLFPLRINFEKSAIETQKQTFVCFRGYSEWPIIKFIRIMVQPVVNT